MNIDEEREAHTEARRARRKRRICYPQIAQMGADEKKETHAESAEEEGEGAGEKRRRGGRSRYTCD